MSDHFEYSSTESALSPANPIYRVALATTTRCRQLYSLFQQVGGASSIGCNLRYMPVVEMLDIVTFAYSLVFVSSDANIR